MESLAAKYPEDTEAQIFYALSLAAADDFKYPDTTVGKRIAGFFDAINANDQQKAKAYITENVAPAALERHDPAPSASLFVWMVIAALLAAATLTVVLFLPPPLVLPALSILFVTAGFGAAGGLYLGGYRLERDHHPGWELAGLLVFLGFAATILTDVPEALSALEQLTIGMTAASS